MVTYRTMTRTQIPRPLPRRSLSTRRHPYRSKVRPARLSYFAFHFPNFPTTFFTTINLELSTYNIVFGSSNQTGRFIGNVREVRSYPSHGIGRFKKHSEQRSIQRSS